MINYVPNSFKAPYKPIPIKIERSVYCEMSFLTKIQPILENPITIFDMGDRDLRYKVLLDMLVNFNLYVDVPENEIPEKICLDSPKQTNDNILQKISLKKMAGTGTRINGNKHFISIHQISEHSTPEQLNSIYLTCESEELCKEISRQYGVMIIRYEDKDNDVKPYDWLSSSIINKQIRKSEKVSSNKWGFLQEIHSKSNSIIIVDGYILKSAEVLALNLRHILDKLLPKESLNIPFNISIVANEKSEKNNSTITLREARESVYKIIQELRSEDFNFTLNVCNMNGREHDRWIITNNIFLSCPSGFDIIACDEKDKTRFYYSKSSNIHASYIYSNKADKREYDSLCQRLIALKNNRSIWINDDINRLL